MTSSIERGPALVVKTRVERVFSRRSTSAPRSGHSAIMCCQETNTNLNKTLDSQVDAPKIAPSRRSIVEGALCLVGSGLVNPKDAWAENSAVTSGLSKYVKRKKLDRIDTYIPPLLAAKGQLIRIGRVMLQSPKEAREQLRSGSFAGLRENVRSVGEYVSDLKGVDAGKEPVKNFFQALEGLDFALLAASRNQGTNNADLQGKLDACIKALDDLLARVPQNIMDKALKVVQSIEDERQEEAEKQVNMNELRQLDNLL